ncbi:hypothetical protein B7W85_07235 [Allorhizobium ampelinum]|nr:glycosyltransferase family 2 protein [Allorhizobium ampelinum]OVE95594.1 hypothetical protein B7W85_07235 [Allorhizobium ampelinum]
MPLNNIEFYNVASSSGALIGMDVDSGHLCTFRDETPAPHIGPVVLVRAIETGPRCFLLSLRELDHLFLTKTKRHAPAIVFDLSVKDDGRSVSFFSPNTGLWASAPPIHSDAAHGTIAVDRKVVAGWERFQLLPVNDIDPAHADFAKKLVSLFARSTFEQLTSVTNSDVWLLDILFESTPDHSIAAMLSDYILKRGCRTDEGSQSNEWFVDSLVGKFCSSFEHRATNIPSTSEIMLGPEYDYLDKIDEIRGQKDSASTINSFLRRTVEPKGSSCIVTTARNEGIYLLEWIAFHKTAGFEKIIIYSNNNDDYSDDLLRALNESGEITWINNILSQGTSAQLKSYGHAFSLDTITLDYNWCLVIDLDEFFILNKGQFSNLAEFTAWHDAIGSDAIALNWLFYGPSNQARWQDDFIWKRFKKSVGLDPHIKSMFRPNKFIHSRAHFPLTHLDKPFVFNKPSGSMHLFDQSRGRDSAAFSAEPEADIAWINHYFFKSCEEFLWKWSRNRGDHAAIYNRSNTALTANFVRDFVHFWDHSTENSLRLNSFLPDVDPEYERLMALRGVSAAQTRIKAHFNETISEILEMFEDAPGIVEAGKSGEQFMRLLKGSEG